MPMSVAGSSLPKSGAALLLIDFINPLDFPGAQALAPAALKAAASTVHLKAACRTTGIPSIYANDNYGKWTSDFKDLAENCSGRKGPSGAIARRLKPKRGDITVLKPMHSAFQGSPLELILKQMRVRTLIIVGLATDRCVEMTAVDAFMQGYKVCVPSDCSAAESEQYHRDALEHMARVLKADTRPWRQLVETW